MDRALYLIKGIVLSFFGCVFILALVQTVFWKFIAQYQPTLGTVLGFIVGILGVCWIGYLNARRDNKESFYNQALYVHIIFVVGLCLIDLIFMKNTMGFYVLLRSTAYFACLQVGAYFYNRRNTLPPSLIKS